MRDFVKKRYYFLIVTLILGVLMISGCTTTGKGYTPDPSIPKDKLATLIVVDKDTHVVSYINAMEIIFHEGGVYEVYTIRETSNAGSMQSTSYNPDIREAVLAGW